MARVYKYYSEFNENRIPTMIADKSVSYKVDNRRTFDSKIDMYELGLALHLNKATEEYVYCACFDTRFHLIGFFEVSHGVVNGSLVDKRIVFQKALLLGAVNIALMHNHPSGDISPSTEDIMLTKTIKASGDFIGIKLVDHIIVGDSCFYSFFESMPELFMEVN